MKQNRENAKDPRFQVPVTVPGVKPEEYRSDPNPKLGSEVPRYKVSPESKSKDKI